MQRQGVAAGGAPGAVKGTTGVGRIVQEVHRLAHSELRLAYLETHMRKSRHDDNIKTPAQEGINLRTE